MLHGMLIRFSATTNPSATLLVFVYISQVKLLIEIYLAPTNFFLGERGLLQLLVYLVIMSSLPLRQG